MSARTSSRLAWGLFALSAGLAIAGTLFAVQNDSTVTGSRVTDVLLTFLLLAFPLVGSVVASRRPANAIGWILCGTGVVLGIELFSVGYSVVGIYLQNMADRLAALGRSLEVASKPGAGTTVTGRVPVRELEPAR